MRKPTIIQRKANDTEDSLDDYQEFKNDKKGNTKKKEVEINVTKLFRDRFEFEPNKAVTASFVIRSLFYLYK